MDLNLLIAIVGALTGIISLTWHIFNSRSKVILESVSFTKADRHQNKVAIDVEAMIRNKSNRATTIEDVIFEFGNIHIRATNQTIKVEANSSYNLKFTRSITPEDFQVLMQRKEVKLGIDIEHTFGRLRKHGYTDFSTPWLSL